MQGLRGAPRTPSLAPGWGSAPRGSQRLGALGAAGRWARTPRVGADHRDPADQLRLGTEGWLKMTSEKIPMTRKKFSTPEPRDVGRQRRGGVGVPRPSKPLPGTAGGLTSA